MKSQLLNLMGDIGKSIILMKYLSKKLVDQLKYFMQLVGRISYLKIKIRFYLKEQISYLVLECHQFTLAGLWRNGGVFFPFSGFKIEDV